MYSRFLLFCILISRLVLFQYNTVPCQFILLNNKNYRIINNISNKYYSVKMTLFYYVIFLKFNFGVMICFQQHVCILDYNSSLKTRVVTYLGAINARRWLNTFATATNHHSTPGHPYYWYWIISKYRVSIPPWMVWKGI